MPELQRVTCGWCPSAGNGLFANCNIERGTPSALIRELRGVVIEVPRFAADWHSTARLVPPDAAGAEAILFGPLALANAGCAVCANLKSSSLGWCNGATTVGVYATRPIAADDSSACTLFDHWLAFVVLCSRGQSADRLPFTTHLAR
jgi:hypothetical protein